MADHVVGADDYHSERKYDVFVTNVTLNSEWPLLDENLILPPTLVRFFIDKETALVTTNPQAFEKWIKKQS